MIYYLSLGANLGEREQTLRRAVELIEQHIGKVLRCSSFYYSEPWGFSSPHAFCNLCCAVETAMQPEDMLAATQAIEQTLGRKKKTTNSLYSDRTIDIDLILAYDAEGDELTRRSPDLTLPHPLWQERDFVRVPLAEILPAPVP